MTSCKWRYFTHNHTSTSWLGYRFSLGSPKSIKIHPLGTMNAYTHFRANPLCRYLTGYTKTLTWWWHNRKLLGNGKVIRIHPLETMDIWTKFHGHPLSRGRKIMHIMYTWSGNARTRTHTHTLPFCQIRAANRGRCQRSEGSMTTVLLHHPVCFRTGAFEAGRKACRCGNQIAGA